jgi:hypothetical protein
MVRDAGVLYRNGGTPEDLRQGIDAAIAHLPELTSIARNRMIQWGSWKYSAEQVVKAYTLAIENKRRKVRPYL